MQSQSNSSRHEASEEPRLEIVPIEEDPEILALWAAALSAEGYEVAVEECEREVARGLNEIAFNVLAFRRTTKPRQLQ